MACCLVAKFHEPINPWAPNFQFSYVHTPRATGFTRLAHFGPDLFPASCMLHVLEHLNNGDLASLDLRKRLLETAFAWLEASADEDSLHHILPASELAQVSDKCGRVAARLGFELLGKLYAQSPRGFHKLMSLDAFLSALTALERTRKVNKCVRGALFVF